MRRSILVILTIVGVLVLGILAVPLFLDANQFRPAIESQLGTSLGRSVSIGDLKLSLFSGTVTARDLSIADDPSFSKSPFVTAKALVLSIGLVDALFHHHLNVSAIDVDTPTIVLIQARSGIWNFSTVGGPSTAQVKPVSTHSDEMAISIKSLKISKARVTLNQGTKPQVVDNVNIDVRDFTPAAVFPFTLTGQVAGGGDIALDGKAGPINSTNAANTPVSATIKVTKLNLAASGMVQPASGIDGIVSMDGTAVSNGRTAELTGKIQAEKLKLAPAGTPTKSPVLLDIELAQDLTQHSGQLKRGDLATGGVKASLTGTWTQPGETPNLRMLLSAPGVPVSGIEELLPAAAIVLPSGSKFEGGTATASLTIAGPATALVISGPVSIRNTRLKGFDLGAKMAPIQQLAGIQSGPNTEIQTLSTNLRLTPEATTLQDIHVVVPAIGELTGAGSVSRTQALDFKMRALVRSAGLVATNAPSGIPFFVGGTASNPQFRPDVAQLAQEQINQRLKGVKIGGVDAGQAAGGVLQGLFGKKKK